MISPYGKPQTTVIGLAGLALTVAALLLTWWWAALALAVITAALLAFFRDPQRRIPTMRGLAVAPADGKISSIHELEHYEPFDGPAVCVRIFLSVFDVHINRAPLHSRVHRVTHKDGEHRNALSSESAERNESATIELMHPAHKVPVAVVRQIAGAIARRIVTGIREGDIVQRGQRIGMIKLGSTTELYLPHPDRVQLQVRQGQRVYAGHSIIASMPSPRDVAQPHGEGKPAGERSDEEGASIGAPADHSS